MLNRAKNIVMKYCQLTSLLKAHGVEFILPIGNKAQVERENGGRLLNK